MYNRNVTREKSLSSDAIPTAATIALADRHYQGLGISSQLMGPWLVLQTNVKTGQVFIVAHNNIICLFILCDTHHLLLSIIMNWKRELNISVMGIKPRSSAMADLDLK